MSLDCWNMFDLKYLTCYTKYQDRELLMKKELDRVGMNGVETLWDFPSPFRDVLLDNVPMTNFCKQKNLFFIGQNNYRAIATAYHLGAKSVLIMQDDIRFMRDVQMLDKIVSSVPRDFDIAMLNHMKPSSMSESRYRRLFMHPRINGYWIRFSELTSSGCYALSRKGMERYLRAYEKPVVKGTGDVLFHDDFYYQKRFMGTDANLYVAHPAPSIQCTCGSAGAHSNLTAYNRRNEKLGIFQKNYGV